MFSDFRTKFFAFFFLIFSFGIFAQTAKPHCFSIYEERISFNKIKISWKNSSSNIKSILIFRDEKPIFSIKNLKPIALLPPESTTFIDTVKFYGFYCYAVLAEFSDGTLENSFVPAVNTSANGIRIAQKEEIISSNNEQKVYPDGVLREQPLPKIAMFEKEPQKKHTISSASRKKARKLAEPLFVPTKLSPHVFEEDLISSSNGDEYLLFEILKTTFIKKNYIDAAEKLLDFLRVHHDEKIENRAKFYLAESYHFLGDQKKAVATFISTIDAFPSLSRKWIDASLDSFTLPQSR